MGLRDWWRDHQKKRGQRFGDHEPVLLRIATVQSDNWDDSMVDKGKEFIDFDRDHIPLNDPNDVTSLFFQVAMKYGGVFGGFDGDTDEFVVMVGEGEKRREFRGPTQYEALKNALAAPE